MSDCTVTGAGIVEPGSSTELWVGCDDGDVLLYDIVDGIPSQLLDDAEEWITLSTDTSDPVVSVTQVGSVVYVVTDGSTVPSSHAFDVDELTSTTAAMTYLGYTDAITDGTWFYISHDNAFISTMTPPGNVPVGVLSVAVTAVDDLAPTAFPGGAVLAVDRGDGIGLFNGFNKAFQTVWPLSGVQAAGASLDTDDEFAVVSFNDRVDILPMSGGLISSTTATDSFSMGTTLRDILVSDNGYTFGGGLNGDIVVLSDRPWVEVTGTLGSVGVGDEVPLEFSVDVPGSYEIYVGGSWTGTGTLVDSGSVTAAGDVARTLTVTEDWPDGDQDVWVLFTADETGLVGHGWTDVSIDVPPTAVTLSESDIGFDDATLFVRFTALDAEDISTYTLYVSATPFTAADYPTGGPAFDGDDALEAPIEVTGVGAGESVSIEVTPLTDYVTYYLAVRATDDGGQEGPMSNVVEGVPRPALTASQRAGDPGGMQCSAVGVGGGVGALWLGGLGLGLVGLRRRRWLAPAAALLVGAIGLAPVSASAQDDEDTSDSEEDGELGTTDPDMSQGYKDAMAAEDQRSGDLTDAWGNVEVRYAYWRTREPAFEEVFGKNSASVLLVEFGPQIYRFIELDFGAGLHQRKGLTVDDSGKQSSTETKLMIVPLSASITPRLHLVDEQAVVPYASIGGDWWLWREREGAQAADNKLIRDGSHFGWHWELGINILLDNFDRDRASLLEAQSGINDSWLVISYRRQTDLASDLMDLSGDMFQVGLKLDF